MEPLPLNQVLCGDCAKVLQGFPDNSIDLARAQETDRMNRIKEALKLIPDICLHGDCDFAPMAVTGDTPDNYCGDCPVRKLYLILSQEKPEVACGFREPSNSGISNLRYSIEETKLRKDK